MKSSWRDYTTILMAFAAVFLCGYGVGHLVGERGTPPSVTVDDGMTPEWEQEILNSLRESLALRPEQTTRVGKELSQTAKDIGKSHDAVLLDYHRHINQLYERLIKILDEEQGKRLQVEKETLERKIELLEK